MSVLPFAQLQSFLAVARHRSFSAAARDLCASLAKLGLGLAYIVEAYVLDDLKCGRLQAVLEPFAPTTPGYFLYFPSHAQQSRPLQLFIETAKELLYSA